MADVKEPCPSESAIERLASGTEVAEEVARHVEVCEACRERAGQARRDAEFLGRVRMLARPELGPEGTPRILGYRVLNVLRVGAQGVVYKAKQESTSRTVAIKMLMPGEGSSSRQRARAEREAEIAARLRHPNIVTVFESRKVADGRNAVVMEFVDGVALDAWKPPGQSASEQQRAKLRVLVAVCNGIHHAHLNGVIHRDLKPDNILVTAEGRPVVLDFGIAKAGGIRTTITGEFAGTPAYASPEQASGRPDDVDALTDVYSLGVIMYRVLCGVLPYELQGSIFEMARTIGEVEPVAPRTRDPSLSPDLEAIMLRAMRKEKERRYQSAAGLARDIERFLAGEPVEARSGSGWYLLGKALVLNRRRLAVVGAAVLLVAVAGIAVALSLASAAESERRAALQREQARGEGIRARAVTELLREALPSPDPAHPELVNIIGSGLGRLYFRLETGAFADDRELDQALRRMWGSIYTGLGGGKVAGLVEYAEVSLRSGLVRLRQEHGREHPDIASSMHELAGVLMVRRRMPEAEAMCRDALAMRAKLLGASSTAAAQSRALLARILLQRGMDADAAREAGEALVVLRTLPDAEADLSIAAMSAVQGKVLLNGGDAAGCEPLMREALIRRLRRLPPEDPELLASLSDLADLAAVSPGCALAGMASAAWSVEGASLGSAIRRDLPVLILPDRGGYGNEPTGRSLALGRVLHLAEQLLGQKDPALVGLLIAQIRAAAGENLLDLKCEAALRAADLLAARFGESDSSVLVCLEEAALSFAFAGHADRAVELAQRAGRVRGTVPDEARDHMIDANARRLHGWYLALAGRCAEGAELFTEAADAFRAELGAEHHLVALTESGLAYCLAEKGDLAQADEVSQRAAQVAERLPTTHSDQLAHIRVARGHVLVRLGRHAEARDTLQSAWDPWYRHLPAQFAWRRTFVRDMMESCTALGLGAEAERWKAQMDTGPAEETRAGS